MTQDTLTTLCAALEALEMLTTGTQHVGDTHWKVSNEAIEFGVKSFDDLRTLIAAMEKIEPVTDAQILAANYPDGIENGETICAADYELIGFARQVLAIRPAQPVEQPDHPEKNLDMVQPVEQPLSMEFFIEAAHKAGWTYAHGQDGFQPLWDFGRIVEQAIRSKQDLSDLSPLKWIQGVGL